MHSLCSFEFCNHLVEKEKGNCFAIIVLQMYCYYNVLWLFLMVPWVGLQYVIMVSTDYTHFLYMMLHYFFRNHQVTHLFSASLGREGPSLIKK